MKRRSFLKNSAAMVAATVVTNELGAQNISPVEKEIYEFREYQLSPPKKGSSI